MSSPKPPLWTKVPGPVVLFLLIVALCWKLVLTNQYTWLDTPDLAHQVIPWWVFQANEWHAGRFPLWDPHHWAGQSLIGQAQPGVAYPINWLLFLFPLRRGWLRVDFLHWYFVVIHAIAAVNMYALCRYLTLGRLTSIFAGILFACTGFVGSNDWPQMLNGAVWAPLVFLFLLKTVDGKRPWFSAACSGAFLGLSWLSGHHQIPIFLTVAVAGAWAYFVARDRRLIGPAVCFLLFTFLIAALQVLPAYEYGKTAVRWVGADEPVTWNKKVPYFVHQEFSFKPVSFFGVVFPGMHIHTNPYLGFIGLTFACLGCWLALREPRLRLWAAIGAGGVLIALGSDSLLHGVLYTFVPMVEKARSPSMAIYLFGLGASVLAGFGLERALEPGPTRHAMRVLTAVFAAIVALAFGLAVVGREFGGNSRALMAVYFAGALALALALHLREHLRRSTLMWTCLVLLLLEVPQSFLWGLPSRHVQDRQSFLPKLRDFQPIAELLRSRADQPVRVLLQAGAHEYNAGDLYGIDFLNGYLASLSQNIHRLDIHSIRGAELFATAYYLGKDAPSSKHRVIGGDNKGLKLYFNADAMPRARLVGKAVSVPVIDEVQLFIHNADRDMRREALFVGEAPELPACAGDPGSVKIAQHVSDQVKLEVSAACKSVVVLADTWDQGWKATVDGKPARIWEAYGAMRAVVVEPGQHIVEMKYRPTSVIAGAALGVVGLLGLVVLRFTGR